MEFVERSHRKEFQLSLLNMVMSRLSGNPQQSLQESDDVENSEEVV